MRLLDIIHTLNPASGGPAEGLRQAVQASRALGHDQQVLTLDAPGAPWLAAFPATVHAVGPARGGWGYAPHLLPWLRRHADGYDAVLLHGLWQYPGLATWWALRGSDKPLFAYPHGMLDPWFRRSSPLKHAKKRVYWSLVEKRVLGAAHALLFTTEEEKRLAPQSFGPLPARGEVIGYGLTLDKMALAAQAQDFYAEWPALRGRRLLLFLGRLHPKKGCDLLLRAFAGVAAKHPELDLVMAGPGAAGYRAELLALTARLGLTERVHFTGLLQGAVKWGALRAAEAFVLPSHQENFGVAVAEALAMGLPVLISREVNIWREVVAAGAGLAEPDTLAGTQALLQSWLTLPASQQAAMRQAAVPCFERHFQMRGALQRVLALVAEHQAVTAASNAALAKSQP